MSLNEPVLILWTSDSQGKSHVEILSMYGNTSTQCCRDSAKLCTVVPFLRPSCGTHGWRSLKKGTFIRGRKQCKPKHVSSGIVVLNVRWSLIRGVSQEGDYCIGNW